MLSSPLLYLQSLAKDINAHKGTENCVHCALRLDKHLAAGENLNFGPVPKGKAHLYLNPLIEEGRIIRSTSTDGRLSNQAVPNTDFIEICNLDAPEQKWIIDTTVSSNNEGVRLIRANCENIKSLLIDLPRRASDGTAYGLIVLTNKNGLNEGHMLNYYISADNQVYFIDSQILETENQVTQELDLTNFRDEIFYLPSRPPEGLKIKIEELLEVKEEPPQLIEEPFEIEAPKPVFPATNDTELSVADFRQLLAKGQLFESVELNGNEAKLNKMTKYNLPKYHFFIYQAISNLRYHSNVSAIKGVTSRDGVLYLHLDDNHKCKNNNDVLEKLMQLAVRKQLPIRKALAQGDLIEKVSLNSNIVTLYLCDNYKNVKSITVMASLHHLYYGKYSSELFKEKFKWSNINNRELILTLRDGHGFKDADEVLAFLQTCAASKKKQSDAVESDFNKINKRLTSAQADLVANHNPPKTYLNLLNSKPKVSSYDLQFNENKESSSNGRNDDNDNDPTHAEKGRRYS